MRIRIFDSSFSSPFSYKQAAEHVFADENGENIAVPAGKAALQGKPTTRAQAGRVALQSLDSNRTQVHPRSACCMMCKPAVTDIAVQ
jgi:hypothetical protein